MGDGWQRPEASEKQVRSTTNLARRKSKYLSLSHSLLPPLLCASVYASPRARLLYGLAVACETAAWGEMMGLEGPIRQCGWMLAQLNLKLPSKAEGMTCFYGTALHAGRTRTRATGRENDERPDLTHKIRRSLSPPKTSPP